MSNLTLLIIGFMLLGFSIPSWLFRFKIFEMMYEGISKGDADALIIRSAIVILSLILIYLGFNRSRVKKYISISKKDEMNVEVSKRVVIDVVREIAKQFSDRLSLKSVNLSDEEGDLKLNLIVELKDTTEINNLVENLMNTIKDGLNKRMGISKVMITVGVEKLAIHG